MKRLGSMFLQDFLLAYRNGHIFITMILLVIMLLAIVFLPRSFKVHNELVLDLSAGSVLKTYMLGQGVEESILYTDRGFFNTALEKNPSKVGVVFTGSVDAPRFEFVLRNSVSEKNLHLLETMLDGAIANMRGETLAPGVKVEYLRPRGETIAFNLFIVPVALIFEVVLLGFFIAAVMVFQEKAEGTLRAYRITPGGTWSYILSKTLLFAVLSIPYGVIPLLVGFGFRVNMLPLLALLVLASTMMTLFGIAVAAFYRNLTEWFFVGVAILLINSLPTISYGLPSFAPKWITLLPSYQCVFAVRDVLFHGASWMQISPTLLSLLAFNVVALTACYFAVKTQMMKAN